MRSEGAPIVQVNKARGRLRLRWRSGGKQHAWSPRLPDNPEGRIIANQLASELSLALFRGDLDETLRRLKTVRSQQVNQSASKPAQTKGVLIQLLEQRASLKATARAELSLVRLLKKYTSPIGSVEEARAFFRWLDDGSRKPSTVNRYLAALRAISPEQFSDIPKRRGSPQQMARPFTADEVRRILAALKEHPQYSHYYPYVLFLLHTGMRTSEAIGMRWSDIDLDAETAYVGSSLPAKHNSHERVRKSTKTGKARVVPLDEAVKEVLQSLPRTHELVFLSPTGKPINDMNFARRCWKKTLKAAGVEYRRPYNCRHTFISHALDNGANPVELAAITGHGADVLFRKYGGIVKRVEMPKLGY